MLSDMNYIFNMLSHYTIMAKIKEYFPLEKYLIIYCSTNNCTKLCCKKYFNNIIRSFT